MEDSPVFIHIGFVKFERKIHDPALSLGQLFLPGQLMQAKSEHAGPFMDIPLSLQQGLEMLAEIII